MVDKDEDSDLTKEIKECIRVDLEMRYLDPDINLLLLIASFLDPRFKLKFVDDRETVLDEMKKQLTEILVSESETDSLASTVDTPPATKKAKGFGKILGKCLSGTTTQLGLTPQEKVKQELDCYLGHPQLEIEESPLSWWKIEHQRYPHLSRLARKYLCLCATSVPSERIFSVAGEIVSDRRSALKPEKVDQLVFLARNLK